MKDEKLKLRGESPSFIYTGLLWGLEPLKSSLYYESIKGELKTRPIYECRCDKLGYIKLGVYYESRKREFWVG
jgi:hypothetical protein